MVVIARSFTSIMHRVPTGAVAAWLVLCASFPFAASACRGSEPPADTRAAAQSAAPAATSPPPNARSAEPGVRRDLSADESMGGHTLARHVGRTDAELAERLRREPQISAASTYTDRATAERAVGAALASAGRQLAAWEHRSGRRPNLVLHYTERGGQPLGGSLSRGDSQPVPAFRALVVLRWDERARRAYVLTSYPEAGR
jgi:hypothetical protein